MSSLGLVRTRSVPARPARTITACATINAVPRRVSRSLALWSAALLALLAAHDLSHALDDGLETKLGGLALVATPQWIVLAVILAVILRADRSRGAAAALLLGLGVTVGFVVIHLLPFGPASYWDLHPSAVSWLLAWVPPALGLLVAARAYTEWRAATPAAAKAASASSVSSA
jgi:hypothetical protein